MQAISRRCIEMRAIKLTQLFLSIVLLTSCASKTVKVDPDAQGATPFTLIKHVIKVPVKINDTIVTNFILDTGIGVTIISKKLCEQIQCKTDGKYTGQRMSGQKITLPLSQVSSLEFAGYKQKEVTVGIFDLSGFGKEFDDVSGFISLNFFENQPFTIDYKNNTIVLETAKSLAKRKKEGRAIPIMFDRQGIALGIFMMMNIPNGKPARMEVDTGSDSLILNNTYMEQLGFQPSDPKLKRVEGKDETNNKFVRYFGQMDGDISPVKGGDKQKQKNPSIMFQNIIYDGLVGHDYFKNFIVTYNLPSAQIIIAPQK